MNSAAAVKLNGNNLDQTSSMFWEGCFEGGREFELELKYGTVILTLPNKEEEIIVGQCSDFPDVADVISIFEAWVETHWIENRIQGIE